jgi:hypothetical protein
MGHEFPNELTLGSYGVESIAQQYESHILNPPKHILSDPKKSVDKPFHNYAMTPSSIVAHIVKRITGVARSMGHQMKAVAIHSGFRYSQKIFFQPDSRCLDYATSTR